jgi:hypothetical protein
MITLELGEYGNGMECVVDINQINQCKIWGGVRLFVK